MHANRLIGALGVLAAAGLVLSGCGSGHTNATNNAGGTHVMAGGGVMSDSEMAAMSTSANPSAAASMICDAEVAQSVQRTFALPTAPLGRHTWVDQTFRCQYQLPHSTLRLSVKDLDAEPQGGAHFVTLRHKSPGASPIRGLQNFGLPAFETPNGSVAFLKDHRTLLVNAEGVATRDLPPGFTRAAVAYSIAASVVACWSE